MNSSIEDPGFPVVERWGGGGRQPYSLAFFPKYP